jgi:hypothetical protein
MRFFVLAVKKYFTMVQTISNQIQKQHFLPFFLWFQNNTNVIKLARLWQPEYMLHKAEFHGFSPCDLFHYWVNKTEKVSWQTLLDA